MTLFNYGGSQNLKIYLSKLVAGTPYLTGLDANGQVLENIFVEIVKDTDIIPEDLVIYLPSMISLNNRSVSFFINMGNYGSVGGNVIVSSLTEQINGNNSISLYANTYPNVSWEIKSVGKNWMVDLLRINAPA